MATHCPCAPALSGSAVRWPKRPTLWADGRVVGAAILSAAILLLTVWAGPDFIGHLLGAGDADHCAVCAAAHGMRAGVSTPPVVLIPALRPFGPPPASTSATFIAPAVPTAPSRAPPPLA